MATNYEYNAENFEEILSRLQQDETNPVSNFNDTNFESEFFNNNFSDIENLRADELNSNNGRCCGNNNESGCCRNSDDTAFSNFDDEAFLSDIDNNTLGNIDNNFNTSTAQSNLDFETLGSGSCGCNGVVNSRECFERGLRQGLEQGFIRGFRRGCEQGRNNGLREGFNRGLERGLSRAQELARASFERGFRCGYERGFRCGYQRGFRDGDRSGFQRGARAGFRRGYDRAVRDILRSINENFVRNNNNCPCTADNGSLLSNGNWRSC